MKAISYFKKICKNLHSMYEFQREFEEGRKIIEQELKAIEIINEKGINVQELRISYSVSEYNLCKGGENEELTKKEYDLLKEVFL